MKAKTLFIYSVVASTLFFTACSKDDDGDISTNDNESSADPGVLAPYDGTYNVTGDGHSRGTVIISNQGSKIDFDAGVVYDIEDKNVYDRISAFNRYQIEFFDENNNQDRIRINLDSADVNTVVGFDYDPGADEVDVVSVTVVE